MKSLRYSIGLIFLILLTALPGRGQSNLLLFVSASGDYIGQGSTYVTMTNFSFSGSGTGISAGAFGFGFTFVPGTGSLAPGIYSNATRWPFNGSNPGIDISGNGRGCNNECGLFQVLEFHTNSAGNVDRLWLTYSNSCECFNGPMTGEIRYNSALAPNPGPQTFLVPANYATIQAAINACPYTGPTTILVSPGTYHEAINFTGKTIALVGAAGAAATVISVPSGQNGVTFAAGETSNSILCGFTIANVSSGGSAVYCNNSSPTIASNAMLNGYNGISCNFSSPTVISNIISPGGGTAVTLGGAGTALIQGNVIQGNAAGISMNASGSPVVANNFILSNRGDAISGGNQNDINIIQNVIAYNAGNAISFLVPSGTRGPVCVNNTIVSNTTSGISISGYDGASLVMNNIVIGKSALNITLFNSQTTPVIQNNDFYNGAASPYSGVVSNLAGINGNISANPLFACDPSGDFTLLPGSPAIDAGANSAQSLPATDLNGKPRILAGVANGPPLVDLGVFEANPAAPASPCMYVNCPANIVAAAATGQNSAIVTYPSPTGTPIATITSAPPSGSPFPIGTNVVTCTATYGGNSANCSFTITVVAPPVLTNTPGTLDVLAGQAFTLSVTPQGSGPFTYQWYFENSAIGGATANPFTLTNAQAANEGVYRVGVFNGAGGTSNTVMSVRVLPRSPAIVNNPVSLSLPALSTANFIVTATGSLPFKYQWLFNGSPISGAANSQYSIAGVQSNHIGGYQAVVMNSLGAATSTVATLTVTPVAPFFTLQPAALSQVGFGSNLTLTALASGSQTINYQWNFNGSNISGATGTSLVLTNLSLANAGPYFVTATSFAGTTNSAVAQVALLQKPAILPALSNTVVDAGAVVTLNANVLGAQPVLYFWRFNGQPLPAQTNASLVISNIQPRQSGFYQQTATNPAGSASSTARVSVLGAAGVLKSWGDNSAGQSAIPTNLGTVVAAAGGDYHSIALRHDGSIVGWGYNGDNQITVPTNALRFVTLAAGAAHNLAVLENGLVVAWGRNDAGQCNLPASLTNGVVSVAAGDSHSLALLGNGTVVAWGDNSFGQISIPQGLTGVQAIAAGRQHSLALRTNGTIVGWGYNTYGQVRIPTNISNAVAITAGYLHSAAVLATGAVLAWGDNTYGQCNVPANATNIVAIAAGDFYTTALKADGTVISWGDDSLGEIDVPVGLSGISFIAGGNYHNLALEPTPGMLLLNRTGSAMVLQWNGIGTLQSGPTPFGPFTNVPSQGRPAYTNLDTSSTGKFFRLIK